MKLPFRRLTIAVTGDFGASRGHEKMKQWIQVNGGRFATEVNDGVTHLICSKDHYREDVAMVDKARALKTVKIVSFDWLEDSLMKMVPLSDRNYLMGPKMRTTAVKKAKWKSNIVEKFEKACKEFVQDMNTDGYEIYRHPHDKFAHDITLARANLLANKNQRYQLKRIQLFVTHSTPKMFACFVKYSAPNAASTTEVLAPRGSSWDTAWAAFERFFKLKTGKEWSMRHVKGTLEPGFVYTPPSDREPQGIFPDDLAVARGWLL
ncbi:hypothetical protein P7C71_g3669, partial [Lecanoromycetidae sp. Uapishka_2]